MSLGKTQEIHQVTQYFNGVFCACVVTYWSYVIPKLLVKPE